MKRDFIKKSEAIINLEVLQLMFGDDILFASETKSVLN